MYKSRILEALQASNENLDEGQAVETTDEVVPAEVVAEPEEADVEVAEVAEAEQEVTEVEGAIEEVEEVAESLESLVEILGSYSEEGLNTQGAQLAGFAAESLFNRLGLEDTGMPSLESFSGHSNRVRATTLSVESIGEKLKQIWEAIKNMLRQLKDKIVAFFKRVFSASERVRARAHKLNTAAKKAKGAAKADKINIGGNANKIAIDGVLESKIGAGMAELVKIMGESVKFDDAAKAANTALAEAIKKAASGAEVEGVLTSYAEIQMPSAFSVKGTAEEGGAVSQLTPNLPGNVQFGLVVTPRTVFGKEIKTYRFKKVKSDKKVKETEIAVLSVADCVAITREAIAMLKVARDTAERGQSLAAESKKIFEGVKVEGEKIADRAKVHAAMTAFQHISAQQGRMASTVAAHATQVANAYLNVVQKSLAQYSGAEEAAEAGSDPKLLAVDAAE